MTGVTTWGPGAEPSAAGGLRGFEGGVPNASAIFPVFPKNKAFFKHILALMSALKRVFKLLQRVLMCSQGLRSYAPTCPPFVTPLFAKSCTVFRISFRLFSST